MTAINPTSVLVSYMSFSLRFSPNADSPIGCCLVPGPGTGRRRSRAPGQSASGAGTTLLSGQSSDGM